MSLNETFPTSEPPRKQAGTIWLVVRLSFLLLVTGYLAESTSAAPVGQLIMNSTRHDYIGGGRSWNVTAATWSAQASDYDRDGQVDYLFIFANNVPAPQGLFWTCTFGSDKIHQPLRPGEYRDCERAAFAGVGHPGLDISGDGRGCNMLTGQFSIASIVVDYSGSEPRLVEFTASFLQYCELQTREFVSGTIQYRDNGGPLTSFPYVTSGKYSSRSDVLKLKGYEFQSGLFLEIDDVRYEAGVVKEKSIKVKNLQLSVGVHRIVIVNPDGGRSAPFEVAVFSKTQPFWPGEEDLDDESDEVEEDPTAMLATPIPRLLPRFTRMF